MADYECGGNYIPDDDEDTDFSLFPSDIATGEYIFLNDCCNYGTEGSYEPLVLTSTLTSMGAGDSQEVTISGGCPPYKWEAESPLSFTSLYTTTVSNTIYLDVGAEAENAVTEYTIKDVCYVQGSPAAEVVEEETAIAEKDGEPWSLFFICNTADCYVDGDTSDIDITASHPISSIACSNPGCSVTGYGSPAKLTTPEGYDSTVSLVITMRAIGYTWANGDTVFGTAVMSVEPCNCEDFDSYSISYTTDTMLYNEEQTLTTNPVPALSENCLRLVNESGFGTLSVDPADPDKMIYTATSVNPNCDAGGDIVLFNNDVEIDRLEIGVTDPSKAKVLSYYIATTECEPTEPPPFYCPPGFYYCWWDVYTCDGEYDSYNVSCGATWQPAEGPPGNCDGSPCRDGIGTVSIWNFGNGCCPAFLM